MAWRNVDSFKLPMSDCLKCVHRVDIPGNCHVGCVNIAAKPKRKTWPGCGMWPINFDSNTIVECGGFSTNPADKPDPILDFLRIFTR